ncbi:MAG: DUF983 domain-containing protein [Chitinophagaceae bacterium]|nr:DUF983 domain-containing protein [Chitinophagaceae bacterium]
MTQRKPRRGYFTSAVNCRCPRCREGKLFVNGVSISMKKNLQMNTRCKVCNQPTELEVGFYYGTSYVSYALTVFLSVVSLVLWGLTIGISVNDNSVFYWLGVNAFLLILLQPWLMRISRSLWISWFVKYDPDWQEHQPEDVSERLNKDQANNW